MTIDLTRISGKKKQVWWMNPVNGTLTYLGVFDSKVTTFEPQVFATLPGDGVLIAMDSSKKYLTTQQTELSTTGMTTSKRDLNE